jgi:hypothetical protein
LPQAEAAELAGDVTEQQRGDANSCGETTSTSSRARAKVCRRWPVGSPRGRKPGGTGGFAGTAVEEGELEVTLADLLLRGADEVEEAVEVARGGDPLGGRFTDPPGAQRRRAELADHGLEPEASQRRVSSSGMKEGSVPAELPNRNMAAARIASARTDRPARCK